MLAFERPLFVLAACAAPLVILAAKRFFRGAFRLSFSLGTPGGDSFTPAARFRFFDALLRAAGGVVVCLLLLAASGPQIVKNETVWLDRGADILFVLDCSPSMAGIDMDGENRFDTARELIKNFASSRPVDAIGLVAVGNEAALLIPPTVDHKTLFDRLERLSIGELGDGTALGVALSLAALHLKHSTAKNKAVVLISDGENNAGAVHPHTAAAALNTQGTALYVIGVGSSGEIPVDYIDPVTKMRRTGSFESRYSAESLNAIAAAANGVFLYAPSREAFTAAFNTLNKSEVVVSRGIVRGRKQSLHEPLIIAAMILACSTGLIRVIFLGAPL
ncbi:MAG: VWA domain-containing protein [Spirochaetaceae bacterium]|jgi:Ca-activated chloride channel family protein|nr:VWA domain-containing protein [Spirochaetaceae bacterium]